MSLLLFLTGHLCLLSFFFFISLAKYQFLQDVFVCVVVCVRVCGGGGSVGVCVDGRCYGPEHHIHIFPLFLMFFSKLNLLEK